MADKTQGADAPDPRDARVAELEAQLADSQKAAKDANDKAAAAISAAERRIAELEGQLADAASAPVRAASGHFDGVPMRHPSDPNASCSYDGQEYSPNEDGFIDVPHSAVEALLSHGFVVAPTPQTSVG